MVSRPRRNTVSRARSCASHPDNPATASIPMPSAWRPRTRTMPSSARISSSDRAFPAASTRRDHGGRDLPSLSAGIGQEPALFRTKDFDKDLHIVASIDMCRRPWEDRDCLSAIAFDLMTRRHHGNQSKPMCFYIAAGIKHTRISCYDEAASNPVAAATAACGASSPIICCFIISISG